MFSFLFHLRWFPLHRLGWIYMSLYWQVSRFEHNILAFGNNQTFSYYSQWYSCVCFLSPSLMSRITHAWLTVCTGTFDFPVSCCKVMLLHGSSTSTFVWNSNKSLFIKLPLVKVHDREYILNLVICSIFNRICNDFFFLNTDKTCASF